MAASKKQTGKSTSTGEDAISLLKADHEKVKGLFKDFDKLCKTDGGDDEKQAVAAAICMELTIHAQAEEEIFYPAAREAGVEDDLLDEAEVEHETAKELIAQISAMSPGDEKFDAKVIVLGEYIDHHVKEEENEMFPKAKKAGMDMEALGAEIDARKAELADLYGSEEPARGAADVDQEDIDPVGDERGRAGEDGVRRAAR